MNTKLLVAAMALACCFMRTIGAAQDGPNSDKAAGPVAAFCFDGNTEGGAHAGATVDVSGDIGYAKGLERQALALKPGRSLSYLTINASQLPFNRDQDFSVQFWVNTTMGSDKPFVMLAQKDCKDNSLASQKAAGWVMYSYGGTWAWSMGSGGRRITHENENGQHMPVNDGRWHQLAMTYDSQAAVIRLYYDGDNKALYRVRDQRGFDFTCDRPLVVGWDGDNGADTQTPVLQAIKDGAKHLQDLIDAFNAFGLEPVHTAELVDLVVNVKRLFDEKVEKACSTLSENDQNAFRQKMRAMDLKPVLSLISKLKANPYTVYQNRNFTSISALARLYLIEGRRVEVEPDVAGIYTRKTRLHSADFEMDSLKIWDRVLSSQEVLASYARHFKLDVLPLQPNRTALRAACWNIWHGGKHFNVKEHGWDSRKKIAHMLKEENADVVMMQETYSSGDFIAAELGYYFAASVDWDYLNQGANLSVLSRYPIDDLFVPETSSFMNCGVRITLSETQDMHVMSNWYGMDQFSSVFEFHKPRFAQSETIPVLLAGDFNAVPHTDGGTSPASRALLDAGFTDAYRSHYPDAAKFPGATHRSGRRIDQIYHKGSGLKNTSTKVISEAQPGFPSDHFLIITDYDLNYTTE